MLTQIKKKDFTLAFYTVLLGTFAGIVALVLGKFLDIIEKLFLGFHETNTVPVAIHASGLHRFLSVSIAGIIVALVWYFLRSKYKLVGIKGALEGKKMPFLGTIIHALTQIFYVSSGGSVGRELAPREVGAMLAQLATNFKRSKFFELDEEDRKLLITAAAGASFAGVYISPLTGTMFCLEMLYKKFNAKTASVALTMSSIATLLGSIEKGFTPYYVTNHTNFDVKFIPFVIIVAPIMGIIGSYARRLIQGATMARAADRKILFALPIAAITTGAIASFFPQIMGNGRGLAQMAFDVNHIDKTIIFWLLFGAVAKIFVTVFGLWAGAFGGTLAPSIGAGASLGTVLGMIYTIFVPTASLQDCALLGAVAFLTATQRAPMMAFFMMFEICHLGFDAILPLALGAALSIAFAKEMK